MKRTTAAVNFFAAQLAVIHHDGRAQAAERFLGNGGSRAVAAVEPNFKSSEIGVHRADDVIYILRSAVAAAVNLAAAFYHGRIIDIVLDAALLLLAVLDAVAVEHFDTVILGRIVRGGNHYAASRAVLFGEHRDRRRRHYAGQHNLAAHVRESLDERGFQLLARNARVAPHDERSAAVNLAERKPRLVGKRLVQLFAVLTSYSVRAEIFTHTLILLFAERRKIRLRGTMAFLF